MSADRPLNALGDRRLSKAEVRAEAGPMAKVNFEVFDTAGVSLFWAPPRKAAEMVSSGAATWINQGWGRLCLRLVTPQQSSNRRNAPSLTSRDSEVSAGVVGTIAEERAVSRRVKAWAPREVTS